MGPAKDSKLAWTRISSVTSDPESDAPLRPLAVYCFGNAGDRVAWGVDAAQKILPFADLFLFDYPGYGDSPGTVSAEAMHDMQLDVARHAEELGKDRPLIFWGFSMGGLVCSEIARVTQETDAVVMEATAQHVGSIADELKPWYMPFMGTRIDPDLKDYNVARALAHFDGPVLVMGAGRDETLPVKLARELHRALEARGVNTTYEEFRGATHRTISSQVSYLSRVRPFFDQVSDLHANASDE